MSAVMRHGNMGHFLPHGAIRLSEAAAAAAGVGASGASGTHTHVPI